MRSCPNLLVEPLKAMSASFLYASFKFSGKVKLRLVLSGVFLNLPLSFQIFAIIFSSASVCSMSIFIFVDYLSSYLLRFHPSPLQSGYPVCGVCLFFVSFINTPASCTITFLPCDTLLLTNSDCPFILESKKQASLQMCVCVCVYIFSHLLRHLSLVFDCWSNWNYSFSLSHSSVHPLTFFLSFLYVLLFPLI